MSSRKQHPAELRERAVAMVFELRAETGESRGTLARVGEKLGVNPETLRNWVEKAASAYFARELDPRSPR